MTIIVKQVLGIYPRFLLSVYRAIGPLEHRNIWAPRFAIFIYLFFYFHFFYLPIQLDQLTKNIICKLRDVIQTSNSKKYDHFTCLYIHFDYKKLKN